MKRLSKEVENATILQSAIPALTVNNENKLLGGFVGIEGINAASDPNTNNLGTKCCVVTNGNCNCPVTYISGTPVYTNGLAGLADWF